MRHGSPAVALREVSCHTRSCTSRSTAHVRELPGSFATGDTLGELTEALEYNVALYLMPTDETTSDESFGEADPSLRG
jgi:hypothetical protein